MGGVWGEQLLRIVSETETLRLRTLPTDLRAHLPPPPHAPPTSAPHRPATAPAADLFEARRDPSVAVPRRPEAVHVYGVDLLSTKDILSYFVNYGACRGGKG